MPKTHRFCSSGIVLTDRRTDGRIAASLNVLYTFAGGGIITRTVVLFHQFYSN